MHETPADLAATPGLARPQLRSGRRRICVTIITPERRLTRRAVGDRLAGMCLLMLATVTRRRSPHRRPRRWLLLSRRLVLRLEPRIHCASGTCAERPQVSATYLPAEELCVRPMAEPARSTCPSRARRLPPGAAGLSTPALWRGRSLLRFAGRGLRAYRSRAHVHLLHACPAGWQRHLGCGPYRADDPRGSWSPASIGSCPPSSPARSPSP